MHILPLGVLSGAAIVLGSLPTLAQVTTRIETRPFYGATVTLEEGVRVFRPLPPHDRVIINPGGVTPLSIGIVEGGAYDSGSSSSSSSASSSGPGFFPGRNFGFGARRGIGNRGHKLPGHHNAR